MPRPVTDEPLLSSGDQEFDLHIEVERSRRNWTVGRSILGSLGLVFLVLGTWIVLQPSTPTSGGMGYVLTALFWFMGATFIGGATLKKVPPPLRKLRLTSTGVTLYFEDGQHVSQHWNADDFGLTLRDDSFGRSPRGGRVNRLVLFAPDGRAGNIPEPVAATVIQSARVRAIPVSTRQETVGTGRQRYEAMVTRIGSTESTPTPR
jgi:hypothetical protein